MGPGVTLFLIASSAQSRLLACPMIPRLASLCFDEKWSSALY